MNIDIEKPSLNACFQSLRVFFFISLSYVFGGYTAQAYPLALRLSSVLDMTGHRILRAWLRAKMFVPDLILLCFSQRDKEVFPVVGVCTRLHYCQIHRQ